MTGEDVRSLENLLMKDLSVLQESPFTDRGGLSELFDDVSVFMDLRSFYFGLTYVAGI